jgi:hypothetical protein
MVEKETINIDAATVQIIVTGAMARRGANGEWSLSISLDGDIPLGDGRILPIRRVRQETSSNRFKGVPHGLGFNVAAI